MDILYTLNFYISLEVGYVCTQDGRCLPVQEVDLPLWKHGEGGKDPKDFGFRFKADDVWHNIQVLSTVIRSNLASKLSGRAHN